MKASKSHQGRRQDHDVNDKETAERHLSRSGASLKESREKISDDGGLIHNFHADGRRPERALIPREQIAGKAKSHHNPEQREADQPHHFTWFFIRAPEED